MSSNQSKNKFKDQFNRSSKKVKDTFKETKWSPRLIFHTTYNVISNLFFIIVFISCLLLALGLGIGGGYFAGLVKDEKVMSKKEIKQQLYSMTESTSVYFGSGESLGRLKSDVQRDVIKGSDMSDNVKNALISTEDEDFYKHNGIVPKAFIRASVQEVLGTPNSSGGSTLTQQLVKNQLLTNETSFERKAKEMLLSMRVEKNLSKDEIITSYLNVVSFGRNSNGSNIAGIESAAQGVFGKSAKDLNVAQSAYLAGLPQNPYTYTPFLPNGDLKDDDSLQYGFNRQHYVLKRMYQEEKIDKKTYKDALKFDLKKSFVEKIEEPNQKYPYLTEEVEKRTIDILKYHLAKEDNISKNELDQTPVLMTKYTEKASKAMRNEGYRVDTTIDKDMYDKLQDVKNNSSHYSTDREASYTNSEGKQDTKDFQHEVGALLKENESGKILAFVGGRDYEKSQINHATAAKRSPGSTMKPLLTYAPAFEHGLITPNTALLDKKFDYLGYSPDNYDRREFGPVTADYALRNSLNLSTLRLYSNVQDYKPWENLNKMGMNVPKDIQDGLALTLGTADFTLEQDVNGYSTLANKGEYNDSYMINSIKSRDGKVIYQHKKDPKRIFSESTTYLTTSILKGVLDDGSGYQIKNSFDGNWAGKTGTSQDAKDSLFVGYTPKVTLGIWMGYDQPISFDEENHYQLYMWRDMVNALSTTDREKLGYDSDFTKPSTVSEDTVCQYTNSTNGCSKDESKASSTLISDKLDTSQKDIKSDYVLKRLGQGIDPNTSSKVKPKEKVAKNSKEAWSYKSSSNDSKSKPSSGTSTAPPG
ncbi:transglycosylase domain-containing protein [Mammaliicoccus sp. Dog046]|uniref:transglycosylase domain-containing protein n=1 Tax=Mammaliicoccus sp. Dog046 TaxID=3034233 RepID=UPI002B2586BE|nr:transglycosylase domain-containing protein [Mammaliicoccus sp. Dog046]WQK86425.1 transglycosylase domain-containing protein [Mammaliicoccus sp. Dog046]